MDEVRRALARLRPPDMLRLTQLAGTWVRRAPRRDVHDLLNEALDRMLQGRRRWPVGLALSRFLSGAMRSIVSDWAREDERQPLVADYVEEGADAFAAADAPMAGDDLADLVERMRIALADDVPALGILDHILQGTSRAEARLELEMDEREYDTAKRRMARRMLRDFGSEWIE
jgi:DNA-directed RNA polymerase specialized sigma24 family protein